MSFLFAELPSNNYLMTEEQLNLWQRSAIFECECDNLINQHIEADDRQQSTRVRVSRRPYFTNRRMRLDAALDAAISTHGLRFNNNDANLNANVISQRNHRNQFPENENWDERLYDVVIDNSYTAAIRNRGLHLPRRNF